MWRLWCKQEGEKLTLTFVGDVQGSHDIYLDGGHCWGRGAKLVDSIFQVFSVSSGEPWNVTACGHPEDSV